jgi:transaldolase
MILANSWSQFTMKVMVAVSPKLANDTKGTIEAAKCLHKMVGCPNVYIKIPATHGSIPSIKEVISLGISVNVTVSLLFMNILIFLLQQQYAYIVCVFEQLIFSLPTYEAVINAYLDGLEASSNTDLSKVSSAAAF